MMRRFTQLFSTPSWTVVALTLLIAATGWVVASGPGMIDQRTLERRYMSPEHFDATREALSRVRSEARGIEERLARLTWVDSLVPLTLEAHRAGEPLAIGWPEGLENVVDERARAVMDHPTLAPLVDDPPAIGVFAVVGSRGRETVLYGETAGQPWCILVATYPENALDNVTFPEWAVDRPGIRPAMLQACTFVRRYGLPGRHVGAWVEARGMRFRSAPTSGYSVEEIPLLPGDEFDLRFAYGGRGYYAAEISNRACRSGTLSACSIEWGPAAAEPEPGLVEGVSFVEVADRRRLATLGLPFLDLVPHLEDHFGEEAMLEFWTSDLPVEQAFEEAFGIHPNRWVHERAETVIGPVRAGPAPTLSRAIPSGLLLVAGGLVGILYARRRTVG